VRARAQRPFRSVADCVVRADIPKDLALHLAAAGAFGGLGLDRREAMWSAMSVDRGLPLLAGVSNEPGGGLASMNEVELMEADYAHLGLSTRVHPMALLRDEMNVRRVLGSAALLRAPHGKRVRAAGMVTIRQRPGTAKGVTFMTLEDEDGQMNLVVFPDVYARYRSIATDAILLVARGKVQREHQVTNLIVDAFEPLPGPRPLRSVSRDFH